MAGTVLSRRREDQQSLCRVHGSCLEEQQLDMLHQPKVALRDQTWKEDDDLVPKGWKFMKKYSVVRTPNVSRPKTS